MKKSGLTGLIIFLVVFDVFNNRTGTSLLLCVIFAMHCKSTRGHHALDQTGYDQRPAGGKQQDKAETVGDKTRRQQESSGHDQRYAFD